MIEVERRRRVDARPNEVWPLVDDLDKLPQWFTFAERFELLSGAGAGRRQRLYGRWGRKRSEVDQIVTAYVPNRELSWEHEAERLDGKPAPRFAASTQFTVAIQPDGDGSIVLLRSRQVPASAIKGVVMRLFGTREIAQNLERSLDQLVATVSSTPR